jgi:hypothetical protein
VTRGAAGLVGMHLMTGIKTLLSKPFHQMHEYGYYAMKGFAEVERSCVCG